MIDRVGDHWRKHRAWDIVLIVLIALAATSGWLAPGLPRGHDAVADMLSSRAASTSIFTYHTLSGWSTDWFMGYVPFSVHSPLSALLVLLPGLVFGWVLGTKLLFLSFFALSGVFAYLYVHELTGSRPAAVVAGLAYVFAPYHIIDVGFEGHQGSFSTPYMLLPLALLLLERSIKAPGLKYVLPAGVVLALLTLTFPQVLPLLAGPFLVLYVILRLWWERGRGRRYLRPAAASAAGSFCLALMLSSFWWLPLFSEIRYSFATSFSLADAQDTSATFWQAVTLRPSLCCAPSSAFGSAGSVLLELLRTIPLLLVLVGLVLGRRNRHTWFFFISIMVAVLLAMGPHSPIDVFALAHRWLPLFNRLRTPVRFLLFASLAYAVVIGIGVQALSERLARWPSARFQKLRLPLVLPILACLLVIGNTWQETRNAFVTYALDGDVKAAMDWLAATDGGDYRVADPPFDAYTYDSEAGEMIRPVFWTWLHDKDTLYGPGLSLALSPTAQALESMSAALERGPFDLSGRLSVFNVRYVLLDKTHPLSANVILDSRFERVWSSPNLDIYENHGVMPRVFTVSTTPSPHGAVLPPIDAVAPAAPGVNARVEYTMTQPGAYRVHVTLDSPGHLVLSESYHPRWTAWIDGHRVDSQPVYECLNGFPLGPGEHDITIQFASSPLRTAGTAVSGLAAFLSFGAALYLLWRRRRISRTAAQRSSGPDGAPC